MLQVIEKEQRDLHEKLTKKLEEVQLERSETEDRLNKWMEEERKSLEERLAKHVAEEKRVLEIKLAQKIQVIEEEKAILEEKLQKFREWQETQMAEAKKEVELADLVDSEHEKLTENDEQIVKKYDKEFCEGKFWFVFF